MPDPRCLRCASKVPWVSLCGNSGLAVYKIVVGLLGGSSALVVDGLHSSSDVVGSVSILAASKVSGKPPDESHPYGHGKAEFIASIVVYGLLLVLSTAIVIGSTLVTLRGNAGKPHFVTLLGAVVSVLGNYIMYLFGNCAGTRCNSPALLADAFENRADTISSIAAVIGIAAALTIHPICDPIAAIAVGAIIFVNCVYQLRGSISALTDRALPPDVAEAIQRVAMTHKGVVGVDYVRTRQTGPRFWVDVGILVQSDLDVRRSDAIATAVRLDLMTRCDQFQHVEVFVSPPSARAKTYGEIFLPQVRERA